MATPSNYPLWLYRGDSYRWVFRFWLDADKTQPADLTGYLAAAAIRLGGAVVALPCVVTLPQEITITIDGATWSGLAVGSGRWDLELIDAAGWVHTPIAGAVSITADVTHAIPEYATR
jgi:hypothetical protein